jgi:hypothetical protein
LKKVRKVKSEEEGMKIAVLGITNEFDCYDTGKPNQGHVIMKTQYIWEGQIAEIQAEDY